MMISLFQYYRIAAAYLILLIHQQFWTVPVAFGRFTAVAVPLFAAMAGFLFAKTVSGGFDLRSVLAKKAKRILMPYVIWAVVYWVTNCVILDGVIKHEAIVVPGVRSWLLGGTACHLWFLPCLFVVFALISCCACIARRISIHVAWCMVVVLVASVATQLLPDATSETIGGYVKLYFGRLSFYFALGSLLTLLKKARAISACIIGLGMVLIGCGSIMMNWVDGLVWSPLLLVVGLILVAEAKPNIALPQWVGKLAAASMGIYLVHVLFTSGANFLLQRIGYSPLPPFMGFVLSVLLFVLSFFVVRLLPKKCF